MNRRENTRDLLQIVPAMTVTLRSHIPERDIAKEPEKTWDNKVIRAWKDEDTCSESN